MNRKRMQQDVIVSVFSFLGAGVRVEVSKIQKFFLKISKEDIYKDLFKNIHFDVMLGRSEQIENAISHLCTSRLVCFVNDGRSIYYETTERFRSRGHNNLFTENEIVLIKQIALKMMEEISYRPPWHYRSLHVPH